MFYLHWNYMTRNNCKNNVNLIASFCCGIVKLFSMVLKLQPLFTSSFPNLQTNDYDELFYQCCGSMTFWGGSRSGSADPCLWLVDPDPDPGSGSCYFRHWPSRCQQKTNFLTQFFSAYYFLKLHLHHFLRIKSKKKLPNSRNQGFSYYFCMMIEGSGYGSRAGSGSGSIPLTSGPGSGRLKNMWIRWIRIRIRIRNTAFYPRAFWNAQGLAWGKPP